MALSSDTSAMNSWSGSVFAIAFVDLADNNTNTFTINIFFANRGWVVIGNPRQPYATGSVHTGFPVYLFRHALTRSHFLRVFSVYGPCGAKPVWPNSRPPAVHVLSPFTPARVLSTANIH